jgi:hypothetical protein
MLQFSIRLEKKFILCRRSRNPPQAPALHPSSPTTWPKEGWCASPSRCSFAFSGRVVVARHVYFSFDPPLDYPANYEAKRVSRCIVGTFLRTTVACTWRGCSCASARLQTRKTSARARARECLLPLTCGIRWAMPRGHCGGAGTAALLCTWR